jgi:hypothetical protein
LQPLLLNSVPMATPRWYMSVLLNLYNSHESGHGSCSARNIRGRYVDTTASPKSTSRRVVKIRHDTHAGKAELPSTFRTPSALSCKHNPGKPMCGMGPMFPVQLPDLRGQALDLRQINIWLTREKTLACDQYGLVIQRQLRECSSSLRWGQ